MTFDLATDRYFVVLTVNRHEVFLAWAEGEKLVTRLDTQHELVADKPADAEPMFVTVTDLAGSETRLRIAQLEAVWESTPETRARDKEIRAAYKADAPDWKDDG